MKKYILLFLFSICFSTLIFSQKKVYLWKNTEEKNARKVCLYEYSAIDSLKNDVCVIVCPGGSYAHLMGIKTEGFEVAKWLNRQGITAFILRYRVGFGHHFPDMLKDIQKAIVYVKENAEKFSINPNKIGVMGFSAGGHLSLLSACLLKQDVDRPNFSAAIYPVVSMQDTIAHKRSRKHLLGKKITQEQKDNFSIELLVEKSTPFIFLVANKDDPKVNPQNSILLDKKLSEKNINHHFLLYANGGHGYGMKNKKNSEANHWNENFLLWLKEIKMIP